MSQLSPPVSKLRSQVDLECFQRSETYTQILDFVLRLATSVHGLELGDKSLKESREIDSLMVLFKAINSIINLHPVKETTASRFGKPEFRDFYDQLKNDLNQLIKGLPFVKPPTEQQYLEIETYLLNSFGDRTRIDYGSGHELNFMCFLLSLDELNYFPSRDSDKSIVLVIFNEYLHTMRRIQLLYWLEPAGSHGVWGLDDYHFLPFLFGAAQLSPNLRPKPSTIHNLDYIEEFKSKYFYYAMVAFIIATKTGPPGTEGQLSLRWSSPMLDDISGVKKWSKIEEGMIKMYKVEVLGKLPVVQHFLFGTILPCPELPEHSHDEKEGDLSGCHNHEIHNTWGDCCGIRIPSAASAKMSENKGFIPFD